MHLHGGGACQRHFLVNGSHVHAHAAVGCVDTRGTAARGVIERRIERDTRPAQARERARAHAGYVLPDATAEDDAVAATEDGQVRTEVLADPVAVQLDGELGVGRGICQQRPRVTAAAG